MFKINKNHLSIIYLIIVLYSVFLTPNRLINNYNKQLNFIPFQKIVVFVQSQNKSDFWNSFLFLMEICGNIILFVPFYFSIQKIFKDQISINAALMAAVLFSVFIESTQYLLNVGNADIDDVVLNTFGTMAGILFYKIANNKNI